jgi:hypothetical protein
VIVIVIIMGMVVLLLPERKTWRGSDPGSCKGAYEGGES